MPLSHAIAKVTEAEDLSADETQAIFDIMFSGAAVRSEVAVFLLALHKKGETIAEILGAARSMRAHMLGLSAPFNTIDLVGTGGDGINSYNVSTAAALVVSACGVPVAKHGNRASSSKSGSSDVLQSLGVNLEPEWSILERCLPEIGFVFLYAPRHHPAMRHVAEIRRELGVRTIFNCLGPLTNPCSVRRHLIGAYDFELIGPMAEVLGELGSEYAWICHGANNMDEISTTGPTDVIEVAGSQLRHFTLNPEDVGLPRNDLSELKGGDAAENAAALMALLEGKRDAYRNIVLLNAAAALVVSGTCTLLHDGLRQAAEAIDGGAARQKLSALIKLTNGIS